MKAILMAAGMGTRISSNTNEPKSLLNIGNGPLIRHTVELLLRNQIKVCICLGFKGELIRDALQGLDVTFYENPFYKVTNSIASLWFARHELDNQEDIILANADVFWQQDILDELLHQEKDVVLLADSSRRLSGDYFFQCVDDQLVAYGKDLCEEKRSSEYVGIALLRKTFIDDFKQNLKALIKCGEYSFWWENALYTMIDKRPIPVHDIAGLYWSEIDVLQDYCNILDYVQANHLWEVDKGIINSIHS